jgi:hypothetical protein
MIPCSVIQNFFAINPRDHKRPFLGRDIVRIERTAGLVPVARARFIENLLI